MAPAIDPKSFGTLEKKAPGVAVCPPRLQPSFLSKATENWLIESQMNFKNKDEYEFQEPG